MSRSSRPRIAYGAHVAPADLAERIDDPSLEIVGGVIRTERDRVIVGIERRAAWPYPAIVVTVVRDVGGIVRFLSGDRINLRSYELRALADLLDDAADTLEGPLSGDGDPDEDR